MAGSVSSTVAVGGKPHLSERDFQKQVLDLARLRGWLVAHTYDSRLATGTGYPDLCLCRPGRVVGEVGRLLFCELKTERGRLRPEQKVWLEALRSVPNLEVYLWKPHDMDEIIQILE